jgi:hypothetical protein
MLRLGGRAHDPHTVAAGGTIGLQNSRQTGTLDPLIDIFCAPEDFGSWDPDSLFPGKFHESGSRLNDRKRLWRPQRSLNERTQHRRISRMQFPLVIKIVQMPSSEVIAGHNDIGV